MSKIKILPLKLFDTKLLMSLQKKELNKELKNRSVLQNLGLRYTSLMSYSSSKENKLPFPIKNKSDAQYFEELLHILECLI